jgi:deazaflavin-dependent oxidoreductase (nitroreductase family)
MMNEDGSRRMIRILNKFMVYSWRLGLGWMFNFWPEVTGRIMVIVHTGRKTGLRRYTPANYNFVDGEIYCTAGYGARADWYRNLIANPQVEIWLPDGWYAGIAEDITDSPDRLKYLRQVIIGCGRLVDLAYGLDPIHWSDEELDKAVHTYKLFHIRRTKARTGKGGPGELAWIWPVAAMLLLPLAMKKQKRK